MSLLYRNRTGLKQKGKAFLAVMLVIVLAAFAVAGYMYFSYSKTATRLIYRDSEVTKIHGVIHWERSNIPAMRIVLAMYTIDAGLEKFIAELDTRNIGYYQFENIDVSGPVFFKVFRKDKRTGKREPVLQTRPVKLYKGRSKYLPIYLPSTRERLADGYKERIEGHVVVASGKVYFDQGDDVRIRLSGNFLTELAKLRRYQLMLMGEHTGHRHFRVYDYYVQEIDNGERPVMGNLIYKNINGARRFYIQGERDGQLLYLPANYRLYPQLKRSIGAKVMVTGPVEHDGIKPLTFELITR